jgi:hypothetical protein
MWNIYVQSRYVGQVGGQSQQQAKQNAARMFSVNINSVVAQRA